MKRATNPNEFKLKIQGIQSTSDLAREEMDAELEAPADFDPLAEEESPFDFSRQRESARHGAAGKRVIGPDSLRGCLPAAPEPAPTPDSGEGRSRRALRLLAVRARGARTSRGPSSGAGSGERRPRTPSGASRESAGCDDLAAARSLGSLPRGPLRPRPHRAGALGARLSEGDGGAGALRIRRGGRLRPSPAPFESALEEIGRPWTRRRSSAVGASARSLVRRGFAPAAISADENVR